MTVNRIRIAAIDIAGELLAECAGVISDVGLVIRGSVYGKQQGEVRLIVEGAALPVECESDGLLLVRPWIQVEHYGSQCLRRISKFDIVGAVQREKEAS